MIKHLDKKALSNVSSIANYLSDELIESHPQLTTKFDLIVASSVCSFLPDYETTLTVLKSRLKQGGTLVQWDWLATDESSNIGLSEHRVNQAFKASGFTTIKITTPFMMNSSKGNMQVIMAMGIK